MNDSNQIMDSLSSEPKGRRKKLPFVLILLALILGVIIWRFKSASTPVEAPAKDTASVAQPSETPKVETPAPAAPKVEEPAPVAIAPVEPVAVEKPRPVKHKRVHAKPAEEKVAVEKPAAPVTAPAPKVRPAPAPEPEKAVVKTEPPAPAPKPEPKPEVKPEVKPEPKVVAKEEVPAPKPEPKVEVKADKTEVKAEAKVKPVVPAPAPKVASATPPMEAAKIDKKFVMEDQPMPEKPVLSDESKLAFNTLPKAVESKGDEVAAAAAPSDAFKQAVDAYHKQDYENAIKLFGKLPKPSTRQRGNATRDQYVEGNFLLGVSLLKSDRAAEAVNAFNTVLDYEKYYPLANLNLGICYVELKQYFKANKAFESVTRDQGYIDPAVFDDVMQRTKYFWALAWTRMYKTSKDADKQAYYQQQASMRWKDYQTWFGKNEKYRSENRKAEDYIKSLSAM